MRLAWSPDNVRIVHNKTGETVDVPLYDDDGTPPLARHLPRLDSEPRKMKAHVLGIALLRERGVRLPADGQDLTEDTDEMTEGMVTIMAVFAQIEKKTAVGLREVQAREIERSVSVIH